MSARVQAAEERTWCAPVSSVGVAAAVVEVESVVGELLEDEIVEFNVGRIGEVQAGLGGAEERGFFGWRRR